LVELAASRSISPSHVSLPNVPSNQRKISKVGEMGGEWRAVRSHDPLQESPVGEPLRTVPVNEVSPVHITGKNATVEQEHAVTVAS
jgi:hypothetical protein